MKQRSTTPFMLTRTSTSSDNAAAKLNTGQRLNISQRFGKALSLNVYNGQ